MFLVFSSCNASLFTIYVSYISYCVALKLHTNYGVVSAYGVNCFHHEEQLTVDASFQQHNR
jgi:hypothetical protein